MDPASGMENAFGRPGGQRRQGTRFPHRFGRRTRRAAHRLHRVIICMHKHDNASRISKTRDDHDGRRLTDTRRFAPTSVHLRRNRRSRSSESVFNFSGIRKYLISLSFLGKSSVRPAQVGRFDVNIVIHGSTAVRGRGDLVAYGWALWKLPAPWTHRTRPPHLGKRCAFSTSFHRAFPIKSSTENPEKSRKAPK